MLHHSLERSHASKMFQLLPIRSQLSIRLLLFTIVKSFTQYRYQIYELQMGSKDGIQFSTSREASMTRVRCRQLVSTEIAIYV